MPGPRASGSPSPLADILIFSIIILFLVFSRLQRCTESEIFDSDYTPALAEHTSQQFYVLHSDSS